MSQTSGMAGTVVRGAGWTTASRFGVQALSIVSTSVVARVVPPRAYGLVGMAAVVIGFAGLFRDMGTALAIIQRQQIDDDLLSSVFWLNVSMGLAVTSACWLAAPWVAIFYREPALLGVLRALSLSFLISSLASVHATLLLRHLQFARSAMAELGAGAAGLVVVVTAALLGAGVWSLVAGALANVTASTLIVLAVKPWRPRLHISRQEIRSIAGFGLNLSAYNFVNYFARNADNLLVGKYLGAAALGFYGFAYNVMLYPVQSIAQTLGRVLFPVFATMQTDHARFRQAYLRSCAAIAFVTFPLMTGATIVTPELIAVFLGPRWAPVVPVLRLLSPVGMLQSLSAITGHIYVATGSTSAMFRWGTLFSGVYVLGFIAGLPWGITGVAAIYAALNLLLLIPTVAVAFRLIELPVAALWKAVQPVTVCTAAMAAIVLVVRAALVFQLAAPKLVTLSICTTAGAASYFLLMYYRRPAVFRDVIMLASKRWNLLGRVARRLRLNDDDSCPSTKALET